MRDRVLLVGYHPGLIGGVTRITNLLRDSISYLDLHVALQCYRPRWKAALFQLYSVLAFALRIAFATPRLVQPLVGSRGDAIRMLPYILMARLRGCKVCLTFHKTRAEILDAFPVFIQRCILSTWRLANCCCFLTDAQRDEFAGALGPKGLQVVIPNAISDEWFRQATLPRSERRRDLVFIGRWSPEKGIRQLLSLMQLGGIDESIHCEIYSDHRPAVNPDRCICHGWLKENDVRQVIREAKLIMVPSHAEAFGLVLLEAGACGTPFVATTAATIAKQSRAGLLYEDGDLDGMRKAVLALLGDDAFWTECSQNGRRWAESFRVSNVVPQWHRLYATMGVRVQ